MRQGLLAVAAPADGWRGVRATTVAADGARHDRDYAVAEEVPVALHYHGVAHAVMMATPSDLQDFAVGFSLSEGIALQAEHVRGVAQSSADEAGIRLDITLHPASLRHFLADRRVRNRVGHGGCGICGVEDFTAAMPASRARLAPGRPLPRAAVMRGLAQLYERQPLARHTHGAHAAAFVSADGVIGLVREDIGRHNAMDKLVGAVLRGGVDPGEGFCLITSRCSVELVQKAVIGGMRTLVSVSAPTSMAIDLASRAGLGLIAVARPDGCTVFAGAPFDETDDTDMAFPGAPT